MNSKKSETDMATRQFILKSLCEGKSLRQVGKLVGRAHATVHSILNKYRSTGYLQNKPRSGRKRKLTAADENFIVKKVKRHPETSVQNLTVEVSRMINQSISAESIRRILRSRVYNGHIPKKKPLISNVNNIQLEEQQETQDISSNIEEQQPSGPSFDIKEEITIDEDDLSLLNIEKYENGNDGLTDVLSEVEISTSPEVVLQSTSAKPRNKKRKLRDNFSNVPNLETVENANEDNLGVELPIAIQNQAPKKRILRSTFKDNINFSPSNSKKSNRKKRKLSDKNGNVEDEFGMSIAARLRNANQSDRAKAIAKQKIELILCDLEQGVFEDVIN